MTDAPKTPFCTVEEAVEEIRNGHMIVLVDDEDRENEGDLTMAAEKITPEAINFMAKYGRGLICLPLTEERCDELHLPLMSPINTSVHGTAFTEAVDARVGVTTGISASDRAITILTAVDPKTKPQDLARPGHIFPLRARNGGVLVRAGQTEASVDLARIAGLTPAGVICEIMGEDGTMSRVPQLIEYCPVRATIRGNRSAYGIRRFSDDRVFQRRRPRSARGPGARRFGRPGAGTGSSALPLPDWRRICIGGLRLPRTGGAFAGGDCQGKPWRISLFAPHWTRIWN